MKSLAVIILTVAASGSFATTVPSQGTNSIQPIYVDCRHSTTLSRELEEIVADPQQTRNRRWWATFSAIEGSQTPEQRLKSAKAVLWTIRTQCHGF
jgi:hypothetical protein